MFPSVTLELELELEEEEEDEEDVEDDVEDRWEEEEDEDEEDGEEEEREGLAEVKGRVVTLSSFSYFLLSPNLFSLSFSFWLTPFPSSTSSLALSARMMLGLSRKCECSSGSRDCFCRS